MLLHSTNNPAHKKLFSQAIVDAYPPDKGLYMPDSVLPLPSSFYEKLVKMSFPEMAFAISTHLLSDEIPLNELERICHAAFDFEVPLKKISSEASVLELFHGPTLAFKDFGARFMAMVLRYVARNAPRRIIVLTATSGDTGGAVASGFLGVENVDVVILYPDGKVSDMQRRQLTTMGVNIKALAVDGTFDDCQRLVKEAFLDPVLQKKYQLCSANSINIGRLIPQSFYYFYAFRQLGADSLPPIISIPSGNYGNLTASLLAKRMGLPIKQLIAASNENDVFPEYLNTGTFRPRTSLETYSSAMDVGNPSNFSRILDLYKHDLNALNQDVTGFKITDEETAAAISELYLNQGYIMDPHTAVAYLALQRYRNQAKDHNSPGIVLSTAHPSKFADLVEKQTGKPLEIPERLYSLLAKTEIFKKVDATLADLHAFLQVNF